MSGSVSVTRSSPFYDYKHDTAYVGDDAGKLHKFAPVFNGAAAEVTTGGWPVTVSTQTSKILTAPVYDGASTLVFVGDSTGYLYSVNSSTLVVTQSKQLDSGAVAFEEAPLVDSTTEKVYVFAAQNSGSTTNASVFQLPYNFTSATTPSAENVGASSTTIPFYAGTFDNIYYTSEGSSNTTPTGNLYVCANVGGSPTLYQVAISSGNLSTITTGPVLASSNVGCSPLTEFYNTNGATDWLFGSVGSTSCGSSASTQGGCVMSFNITTAAPTIGPWTPSTAFGSNAEVMDTSGRIQKCTGGGCGVTGSKSGTSTPSWSTTTSDGGLAANSSVGNVSCNSSGTCSGSQISLKNTSGATIAFSMNSQAQSSGNITMNPSSGTLSNGSTGTIAIAESGNGSPNAAGQSFTIGSVTYTYEASFTSGASASSPQVDSNCTGCHPEMNQNMFAAITGLASNCTYSGASVCFSPFPLTWTSQGAGNGQTTAPQATGTSGIIIDNAGSAAGEANLYFGTLGGTGATNSGIKMSQAGLQ